jgi:anthranilate/para-aminobenzoate synthase component I
VIRALFDRPEDCGVFDVSDVGTLFVWGPRASAAPAPVGRRGEPRAALPFAGGVAGWVPWACGADFDEMGLHPEELRGPGPALLAAEGGLWWADGRWVIEGSAAFHASARALLAAAAAASPAAPPGGQAGPAPRLGTPEARAAYISAVAAARAHIAAGDIYQVCLAHRLPPIAVPDAVSAFLRVRAANPAARGALVRIGDTTVLSNSPETFLDLDPSPLGLVARSVPIKGTARAQAPRAAELLLASPKETAELTMITDLVRNDLGRVAADGAVRWGPRQVRPCGDLLHAEQAVEAQLRPEVGPWEALGAAFPPGSVSGAPKIRATQIIAALEAAPRGVYCGAIGFQDAGGAARWSVAIRVAVIRGGWATVHVGAGIVADSEPAAEWEETLAKAGALVRALTGGEPA